MKSRSLVIVIIIGFICSCALQKEITKQTEITKTEKKEPVRKYTLDSYSGPKKKVAVTKFINATRFGKRRLGDNISDVLITELSKSKRFVLLERENVDQILEQVSLSQAGLTEGTLDELKLLDADYIITGKVTHYSVNTTGSRGIFTQTKIQQAEVAADVRMIDVRTGEIVLSETGEGFAEKIFKKVMGVGESGGYDESLEMDAFRMAVIKLTENIVNELDKKPWICNVVKISGTKLYINAGKKSNIKMGETLAIYQKGQLIKNLSGKIIGFEEQMIDSGTVIDFIGEDGAIIEARSGKILELPLICKISF